jgi:hypothetical protein
MSTGKTASFAEEPTNKNSSSMLFSAFAVAVMILSAGTAAADCPDRVIELGKYEGRDGRFQWQGQCFRGVLKGCKPCGPVHKKKVPYLTKGGGSCTRKMIANHRADGCSAPSGEVKDVKLATPYKWKFKAACDEHDVCYATPGTEKEWCDRAFYQNMMATCKHAPEGCGSMAYVFFQAVYKTPMGLSSYHGGQRFARENCQ